MCSPVVSLYAELNSENTHSLSCVVEEEEVNEDSVTVAAGECGAKENEKYSLTLHAENHFGLSSSSEPVTVCELGSGISPPKND